MPKDAVGRENFTFHPDGTLAACPQGHSPIRHALRVTKLGRNLHAYFDGKRCRCCPLLGRCVARAPNNGKSGSFHVELTPQLRARDEAYQRQQAQDWRKAYAIRGGIEATNSELKYVHGLARLRVRRMPRVRLAVLAKLTACNVRRWLRAAAAALASAFSPRPALQMLLCAIFALTNHPAFYQRDNTLTPLTSP